METSCNNASIVTTNYKLPKWRMYEITEIVIKNLISVEFYKEDFDYKKLIKDNGIVLRKISDFLPENLAKIKDASLSTWEDGFCCVFDTKEKNNCKIIAYNDEKSETEIMIILLHEFAHIVLGHTQQSINGEAEAAFFQDLQVCLFQLKRNITS